MCGNHAVHQRKQGAWAPCTHPRRHASRCMKVMQPSAAACLEVCKDCRVHPALVVRRARTHDKPAGLAVH
eukprot:356550-Chlamydomonas_euryale.AAC.8